MGTKNNPGKFDCYDKDEPDEPLFVLLARDPPSKMRYGDGEAARVVFETMMEKHLARYVADPDVHKACEALDCMFAMFEWQKANRSGE